jgi:hypothetical protein
MASSADNPNIHIKVMKCLTSWVSIQAITLQDITDNLVLGHAFTILHNHQVSLSEFIAFAQLS